MVKRKAKAAKKTAAKSAKKSAPKRAAKSKPAKNNVAAFDGAKRRAAKAAPRKAKGPQQQELIPGVRYADLDRHCSALGQNSDETNQLIGEAAGLKTTALRAMRSHGVTHYKSSGVALSIVPGDEKLSVKKDRDRSGAGEAAPAVETTGEGQDPANIAESLTERDEDLIESEG